MPSGQNSDGDADGDHGEHGQAADRGRDHLVAGRLGAGLDDLEQPVLGGEVVEQAEEHAAGDAAGELPAVELAEDPEGGDHHHAGDEQRLALVADHPPGRGPAAGGLRCLSSAHRRRQAIGHQRSPPQCGTDPEPEADTSQHDAERDACQRERRRGAGRRGRRATPRTRPPTTAPTSRPPSPMRSRPRRVGSECCSSTIHPGGFQRRTWEASTAASAPRRTPDRPRRRRETTTARAAHEPRGTAGLIPVPRGCRLR